MAELIIIVFLVAVYLMNKTNLNRKVDNYDMSKVSMGKMAMDADKSPKEIQKNLVAGKYDKDDKWKI